MIDVDLRRYGTDKEYEKFVNGIISGADVEKEPFTTQYLGEPWSCRTCEYGPKPGKLYNAACDNCIDGSNFWRKKETKLRRITDG